MLWCAFQRQTQAKVPEKCAAEPFFGPETSLTSTSSPGDESFGAAQLGFQLGDVPFQAEGS